ncbi:hypothetical protein SB659_05455 [Arthrobacter sp. SIMBA_036]
MHPDRPVRRNDGAVKYRTVDAVALATAILEAAGLDPQTAFTP